MSSVDRILLSEGCCSFGLIGESGELWMALLLGVSFSGIMLLSYNILTGRLLSRTERIEPNSTRCTSPDCIRCRPDRAAIDKSIETNINRYLTAEPNRVRDLKIERVRIAVANHLAKGKLGLLEKPTSDPGQNPTLFHFPKLKASPWWDVMELSPQRLFSNELQLRNDLRLLERNAHKIASDFRSLDQLFRRHVMDDTNGSNSDDTNGWQVNVGGWRVYHLLDQGILRIKNCFRCPDTAHLIRQLERLMVDCVFGYVTFSVLEAGTTINTHCGSTNVRLRCHLGLDIPDGCQITVADTSRSWTKKRCLLFDDSYPHSVSHTGSSPRAIFMVDFWHPDLSSAERIALENIFPSKLHGPRQEQELT